MHVISHLIVAVFASIGVWAPVGLAAVPQSRDLTLHFFERHDKDRNGTLSVDEFPFQLRKMFSRIDANHDGEVSQSEDRAFRSRGRSNSQASTPNGRVPVAASVEPRAKPTSNASNARVSDALPQPDFENVSYGPDPRNVYDVWQAKVDGPAPLVVFYHGGAFLVGDKRGMAGSYLQALLDAGFNVAAANYRFTSSAPYPAQMNDCARALQHIRANTDLYGIDASRVAATGGSAGAGISQWLAFHEDLADPSSQDPIARESTRLKCVVVMAAQTTYDPREHQKMFSTDDIGQPMLKFYGISGHKDFDNPKFQALFEDASPINHLTADDPPVMLYYKQANEPLGPNPRHMAYIHHPKFGELILQKSKQMGTECVVLFHEDYLNVESIGPVDQYIAFFKKYL